MLSFHSHDILYFPVLWYSGHVNSFVNVSFMWQSFDILHNIFAGSRGSVCEKCLHLCSCLYSTERSDFHKRGSLLFALVNCSPHRVVPGFRSLPCNYIQRCLHWLCAVILHLIPHDRGSLNYPSHYPVLHSTLNILSGFLLFLTSTVAEYYPGYSHA